MVAEQPAHLRAYLRERLVHHRAQKDKLGRLPPKSPSNSHWLLSRL
ncbi:hypothetical protein [Serratia proteamaculans]